MAWIELHQTLPTNKKTLRLKSILKIDTPAAVGHLCMLWLWAIDNAQDGCLQRFLSGELAEVAGWKKNPDAFMDALRTSGFVDADMCIHDWSEYAGKLIEKRKTDADRKRTVRGRSTNISAKSSGHPEDVQRTSDGHPADIHKTSDGCPTGRPMDVAGNRTVPYLTVPNSTSTSANIDIHEGSPTGENEVPGADELKEISDYYTKSAGKLLPSSLTADIQRFLSAGAETDLIKYALSVSLSKNNVSSYFRGVMQNKIARGITTYRQCMDAEGAAKQTQNTNQPDLTDPKRYAGLTMDDT